MRPTSAVSTVINEIPFFTCDGCRRRFFRPTFDCMASVRESPGVTGPRPRGSRARRLICANTCGPIFKPSSLRPQPRDYPFRGPWCWRAPKTNSRGPSRINFSLGTRSWSRPVSIRRGMSRSTCHRGAGVGSTRANPSPVAKFMSFDCRLRVSLHSGERSPMSYIRVV